ncbi:TetR/AcrR family transcriptional regulator [Cellulomonas xylanilytica]|uniref:TetR family transcriptional regulator n=1 Tax=Cellulomonas xylanilytica TaxID=233583 RepID=A0A510V5C9_9CELL|nr:TetR/AcrR family transcriptional regulator [Cellulomonas xylanilytica]GEK20530.1 TetR family transcriptional regulator [Cellulomonas xylanilytica]
MTSGLSDYHRQVRARNREAILDAAADLFLEAGFDGTSLARVAESAGVSKATLFKQFPTKSQLFEATVLEAAGIPDAELGELPSEDFRAGLVHLGRAYADLLARPRVAGLMRTIIAELPRFPELQERTFDFGTLSVLRALRCYLLEADAAGVADIDDLEVAATQFLGLIASAVFWPGLVHGSWSITEEERLRAIDEAARTIAARYSASD